MSVSSELAALFAVFSRADRSEVASSQFVMMPDQMMGASGKEEDSSAVPWHRRGSQVAELND